MKLKLAIGFGVRNIVPVVDGDGRVVGEAHKTRTSGWRGGPSYRFYPNADGEARGLRFTSERTTKELLLVAAKDSPTLPKLERMTSYDAATLMASVS